MSQTSPCPDVEDLRQFLLGRLADPQADPIGQHLPQCPHCLDAVAALEADSEDRAIRALQALAVQASDRDLLEGLISRVQQLQPPTTDSLAAPARERLQRLWQQRRVRLEHASRG